MKIKLRLSIFALLMGLFAISGYSQTQQMISISNLKYRNGSAIPTGTPIQIAEGGTVSVTFDLGINNPGFALIQGGTLSVYSKLNSSTNIQHVSIFYGQNAISGSVSRQCTIELKSSHFPSGTGSIYAQFSPVNNSPILGTSVPVKTVPLITSNYIIGNQTVYEGDPVGSINGPTPSGGDGLYTYLWQKKTGSSGAWTTISGATGVTFQPTNVSVSTISYRRIVTSLFGTLTSTSNEVTVIILPKTPIQNNTITLEGNTVLGSLPTGGTGTYQYSWVLWGGPEEYEFPDTGQNLELPSGLYNELNEKFKVNPGLSIVRYVKSGIQKVSSNVLKLPPTPPIENNTISLNGNTVLGSLPTGGTGIYQYSWVLWGGPEEYEFPDTGQNLELPSGLYNDLNEKFKVNPGLSIVRYVKSGIQKSSNVLKLLPTPPIENNTITLNGNTVLGSLPTGGTGIYKYSWVLWGGPEEYEFPDTGQNLELPSGLYNELNEKFKVNPGLSIVRYVKSGIQKSSNVLKLLPTPLIENNIIAANGNMISGSLPTGGIGTYEYSWYYSDGAAMEGFYLPGDGQNLEVPSWMHNETYEAINASVGLYVSRTVKSGIQSLSNVVKIPLLNSNRVASNSNIQSDLSEGELTTVSPNPTSGSINFSTTFSTEKDIEIIVYSESLADTKSVFKGRVIPNQIVNWNIPSNYSKGVYFYKILSDNKEVKSGKFIFR